MPRKGHSAEQIVYTLRQIEGGKKVSLCLILFDFAGHLAKSVPASLVRIRLSSSKLGRILAAVSRSLGTAATSVTRVTRRLLSIDRKT